MKSSTRKARMIKAVKHANRVRYQSRRTSARRAFLAERDVIRLLATEVIDATQ